MLLALTMLAINFSFLAVALCLIVLSASEAHRRCSCVVGHPISHACCVSKLRLDSILGLLCYHLGVDLMKGFAKFPSHLDLVLGWAEAVVQAGTEAGPEVEVEAEVKAEADFQRVLF